MTTGAPAELEVVRSFVNTLDLESGEDAIATGGALGMWLREQGLLDEHDSDPGDEELEAARALREALRRLAATNAGEQLDATAAAVINEVGATSPVQVEVSADGRLWLSPRGRGGRRAIARLLAMAYTAMADGSWERLKPGGNDACQWLFFDRSKNQSRRWCTMETCGNVMNARAYRARRREPD